MTASAFETINTSVLVNEVLVNRSQSYLHYNISLMVKIRHLYPEHIHKHICNQIFYEHNNEITRIRRL